MHISKMSTKLLFLTLIALVISGNFQIHAVVYDHSFTAECLAKPLDAQYGGGVVVNPQFNEGLKGWTQVMGEPKVELRTSPDGNQFMVASVAWNRTANLQTFHLEDDKLYTFSAWAQVKGGQGYINALVQTENGNYNAAWLTAKEGCWSMLKGGFVINGTGTAYLRFESNDNSTAEILIDNVSVQPFTYEEWKSDQNLDLEKARKGKVKLQAVDAQGRPRADATVSIKQTLPLFPFGCAINQHILNTTAYAKWFLSRGFRYTVFENELKWTTTEAERQGLLNYTLPDALLAFTKSNGLTARGHTVLWASQAANPLWIQNLSTIVERPLLQLATDARINSVMSRYKGQFIHWDIENENMHNTFMQDVLGPDATTSFYKKAHEIDSMGIPFLNEFYTIERSYDGKAAPWVYLQKINQLRAQGYTGPLGIGLQAHFAEVNLPYLRASLDILTTAQLPIWITELDVSRSQIPHQAEYLEELLRELHSQQAVQGILMWAGWWPKDGCWKMCLTDDNFNNLPTGDVVDKVIAEWTYGKGASFQGKTDANGYFETSLFYGDYEASISQPQSAKSSPLQQFKLVPNGKSQGNVALKITL